MSTPSFSSPSDPSAASHSMSPRGTLLSRTLLMLGGIFLILQMTGSFRSTGQPVQASKRFLKTVHHSEYKQHLAQMLSQRAPHYVLFTSGYYPSSEVPWCPDCGVTLPVVRQMVMMSRGSLLEVSVGEKTDWRDPQHPVKVDPQIPVGYVPTLVHWTDAGPGASISRVLSQDAKVSELRLAVAHFMKQTAGDSKSVLAVVEEVIKSKGKSCGGC